MSIAAEIIAFWGGIRPTARKLRHKHHTTVQGWKDRDAIPPAYWPDIIKLAAQDGVALSADHFIGCAPLPSVFSGNDNQQNESPQQ